MRFLISLRRSALTLGIVGATFALPATAGNNELSDSPGGDGAQIKFDDGQAAVSDYTKQIRAANAPVFVRILNASLSRRDSNPSPVAARKTANAGWYGAVMSALKVRGYQVISDDQMRTAVGMTSEEMQNAMINMQPFGWREAARARAGELHFLFRTGPPACPDPNGAIGIGVDSTLPDPNAEDDYGSITFIFIGIGTCGPTNELAIRYLNSLSKTLKVELSEGQ